MIAAPISGPGPATTCHRSRGMPASSSSSAAEQRRQHGLGVGLDDDRVAGHQGGDPVAQRHRERVVPGRDDADHALGDVVDVDPGQGGDHAQTALAVEVPVGRARVVAGGQRDVQRLVEGVLAGLAGLPHDQVDDLVLAVEHQVVEPQQRLGPLVERRPRPGDLRASGAAEGLGDVVVARLRHVGERLAGQRRGHHHRLPRRRGDALGQSGGVLGLERQRGAGVVLGVARPGQQRVRVAGSHTAERR